MLSLKEWITVVGAGKIAKMLKVHVSSVNHWKRGWVLPSDLTRLKIEKITDGKLTADAMMKYHHSPENKKNRWNGKR